MNKKLIGLLLALCMIISLLPVTTLAAAPEGWTVGNTAKIKIGGSRVGTVTKGTNEVAVWTTTPDGTCTLVEDPTAKEAALTNGTWNAKLEYVGEVATLTLKNATIGKYNESANTFSGSFHGIETMNTAAGGEQINLTIILQGTNTINAIYSDIGTQSMVGELIIKGEAGSSLTSTTKGDYPIFAGAKNVVIENANLKFVVPGAGNSYRGTLTPTNLSIKNSSVEFMGKLNSYSDATLQPTNALTIENSTVKLGASIGPVMKANTIAITGGSTVTVNSTGCENGLVRVTEALSVNGSTLNVASTSGGGSSSHHSVVITETGAINFTDATVNIQACTEKADYSNVINITGAGSLTIDGNSNVTLNTPTPSNCYAIKLAAGASATIKAGTVTLQAYNERYSRMAMGAVKVANGASFTIEGGDVTFISAQYAVEGNFAIKGGSVTVTLTHDQLAGATPFNAAPTVNYTGAYYMMLGEARDGSDAEVVTDIEDATISGYRYFKLAAGNAPSGGNGGSTGGNEGGNQGGTTGGNQGGTTGGNQGGTTGGNQGGTTGGNQGGTTGGNSGSTNHPTGDNTNLVLLASLLSISVLGLGAVLVLGKKNTAC